MKIYEIGTGYTSIPAKISAATEIVVEQLTKAMKKQGIDVTIIDICDENRAKTELPIKEVKVPRLFVDADVQLGIIHKLKRVVYSVALAQMLKKILKKSEEQVVFHFHNQYNLFFFLKLVPTKLRDKCIMAYTNHSGVWRLDWKEIEGTIKKRYFQEAECMKKADIVYLLNEETKQNVMQHLGVKEEKIICINNGVNTEVYRPLDDTRKEELKAQYELSGKKVILQVGSVYENKGQKRAIEYLLPLLKENKDVVYAYVGGIVSEEYQQEIVDYAKEEGISDQVKYMGMLSPGEELNGLYNAAEATIMASQYESFGMVVIESMSAGIPALLDKKMSFFFGKGCIPYEKEDLVCVVKKHVLENQQDYTKHCEDARTNAVDNYSWERIASDYVNSWK